MSNGIPILVIIRDGVVHTAITCADAKELEDRFADEILAHGIEPCDADFDNGYFEFDDCVSSVCMTWSDVADKPASGKRTL